MKEAIVLILFCLLLFSFSAVAVTNGTVSNLYYFDNEDDDK